VPRAPWRAVGRSRVMIPGPYPGRMPAARVLSVAPGSPADQAGVAAGDEILTVNGEQLRDVIAYQLQADAAEVDLEVRRGGLEQQLVVRKRRGATSRRWLELLLAAGIEVHGQVVVCPDINDGAVLDDTLLGVFDRFPQLATLGVVPLGVSAHSREPEMRPHTIAEARAVVETVYVWQQRYAAALGRRLVFASDEYYLLADFDFPALDAYDDCLQHENGIGMARTFEAEVRAALAGDQVAPTGVRSGFFAAVDGAPAEGYRAPRASRTGVSTRGIDTRSDAGSKRSVGIVTGELGARVLAPLVPALGEQAGADVRLVPVANAFFGGNI